MRSIRHLTAAAAACSALLCATPAFASAAASPHEPLGLEAEEALEAADAALSPGGADPDVEASAALTALGASLGELEPSERRQARGLLARPTDGPFDQWGDGYPAGADVESKASEHFCVWWVKQEGFADAPEPTDVAPANGTPDYVERVLSIAEHSYDVEVAPGPLGWRPPKPDGSSCPGDPDPDHEADIYLKQLGHLGVFGYESPDPGQGGQRRQHGYIVIDDDYANGEYGFADPLDAARATLAHEFNHLLQVNYSVFQEVWLFEATATWVEEEVFPEVDDYLNFVKDFARHPGTPITAPPSNRNVKAYGTAVWNHWLAGSNGGLGASLIPAVWDLSAATRPQDFAIEAYDRAIDAAGGRSFAAGFAEFAGSTAEWQTGDGGFPDAAELPRMRRQDTLRRADRQKFRLDHTEMRLFDIAAPRGANRLRLRVRVQKGVRSGLVLVARDGAPLTGDVTRKSRFLARGGRGAVTLRGVRAFERITAVVVNADGRARGRSRGRFDYTRDDARFIMRLTG